MFYGATLKPGVINSPGAEDGQVLHLSSACLVNPISNERTYVQVTVDGKTFCLCSLQKDKCENVTLDLFLSTQSGVKFQTSGGKNEVHVCGYFEPEEASDSEDDDEDAMMQRLSEDPGLDDEESDEESDDEKTACIKSAILAKLQKAEKARQLAGEEASDDEEDDDEALEDEKEDDDDAGETDDESDEEEMTLPTPPQIEKKQSLKHTPQPEPNASKKRKAEEATQKKPEGPAKKQQKTDASSPETQWEKAITEFLKKSGRTQISILASKVKRPENLKTTKYSMFLKSRPQLFAIEGQNVSLKS